MKKLFFIVCISFCGLGWSQNETLFSEATKLYNEGAYVKAIENYTKILETGKHSSALYYNLANAHYKLNHIAPSIYYYEKALLLSPDDADIKNNLAFAQNMTIDVIEELPQPGFSKMVNGIIGNFTYEQWALTSIVCMFLFVIGYLVYYFSITPLKKRIAFIGGFILLGVSILSVVFAYSQYNLQASKHPAIIFAKETNIMAEPNNRSAEVFKLHEGAKVNVEETINDWKKIKLSDGKEGWLPSSDVKEL